MERIQHAIEKARAARQGDGPVEEVVRPTTEAAGAPSAATSEADKISAQWYGLREVSLPPRALIRSHIVTAERNRDAVRFDMMRTKLLHQLDSSKWRRVGVTSPGPNCGKSTVCLNLAFSLARQPELRVAVVEADLRRPSIAQMLGIKPQGSVGDFLAGRTPLSDVAIRLRPNLAVLLNPEPRHNAAELFQSRSAAEALDVLEASLAPHVVLFDMPPTLTGDDVMAFAAHTDAVLIIAGAGTTTVAEIDACERELATRTNVMGVVVNKCRYLGKDYAYDE
ncbi:CpsD/CapB family tyrosine-protein kinase [Rubellimicrobium arenae]|uniref:CpsD/CapB family tyrosine-protein kinase n=1 Tax=Rubellimicrobium arenae TaxID=2817372 RepID=UPI001B318865|nr:CpsD/CapB family tyrosine-protein kinase [Rubellimicrobium arenae]